VEKLKMLEQEILMLKSSLDPEQRNNGGTGGILAVFDIIIIIIINIFRVA